jgi:hypothetical protein
MRRLALSLLVVAPVVACAQQPAPATPAVEREVKGQTILSNQLPAADLTFSKDFRYLGSQVVNLYGSADAEQHIFVASDTAGRLSRIYWIQFEHYLPTNSHTYTYRPERTVDVGGLQFIYDVQAFSDYGRGALQDPRSDGAAVVALLTKHNLAVPARFARVRMFHLPSADHRSELMIIYGEALPADSRVPVSEDGVSLDTEDPADAKSILQRALQGMTLRRHAR